MYMYSTLSNSYIVGIVCSLVDAMHLCHFCTHILPTKAAGIEAAAAAAAAEGEKGAKCAKILQSRAAPTKMHASPGATVHLRILTSLPLLFSSVLFSPPSNLLFAKMAGWKGTGGGVQIFCTTWAYVCCSSICPCLSLFLFLYLLSAYLLYHILYYSTVQ